MYDHLFHCRREHFCRCCLHAFNTDEILKHYIKDCFKNNGKQTVKIPKKGENVKFKIFERKIKSPSMIYVDFESILMPEENGKQNPDEPYSKKYQKYVACSYGDKLTCVDDKFSKNF